jgi:hypothetical protein
MSEEYEYEDDQIETEYEEAEQAEDEIDQEEPEAKGNPAWDELYNVLPKSLHGMVEPVISKWQSGVDSEFEKFSPYRKFAESGVNPDVIEASMELARQVAANPKAVYDELAERYGWAQANAMIQQATENLEEAEDYEDDPFGDDPTSAELKAMKAELDALKGTLQSREEQEEQAQLGYEIESSIEALTSEYGDFDQEAVVRRAMLLADDYPNASLEQLIYAGYEQYNEELDRMRGQMKRAPRIAGGNANKVPAAPARVLNTREDRIAAIEEIVKRTLNT